MNFKSIFLAGTVVLASMLANISSANQPTPEQIIETTANSMLKELNTNKVMLKKSPEKLYDLIEKIVAPNFDFDLMSQYVMGRVWRTATDAQKSVFTKEFKVLLINTYGSSLLDYTSTKITILPQAAAKGDADERTVKTEAAIPGKPPFLILYKMSNNYGKWLVYDVTIEGLSVISNYRTEITAQVKSKGIDGMIEAIRAKNSAFVIK